LSEGRYGKWSGGMEICQGDQSGRMFHVFSPAKAPWEVVRGGGIGREVCQGSVFDRSCPVTASQEERNDAFTHGHTITQEKKLQPINNSIPQFDPATLDTPIVSPSPRPRASSGSSSRTSAPTPWTTTRRFVHTAETVFLLQTARIGAEETR